MTIMFFVYLYGIYKNIYIVHCIYETNELLQRMEIFISASKKNIYHRPYLPYLVDAFLGIKY